MLQSISWQQYIFFLLAATLCYYLFVWIVYFKARIPSFSGMRNFKGMSLHGEDEPDEMLSTAQHVMDELRTVFEGKQNMNELVMSLQQHLSKYNQWDEPGFRETLNEFIAAESESTCSIRLGEDELRAIWKG